MKRWGVYIALCVCAQIYAQTPLERFLSQPAVQHANVSVLIRQLSNGEIIDTYRSQDLVTPASVMKLFTTATALECWGNAHRFETQLCYSGSIQDSILNGNLYIVGKGDPTLGGKKWGEDAFLKDWTSQLRSAGILHINGSIIADYSYYDGDAMNPGWLYEDIGNYYAPGIFALAYLDNSLLFQLKSGPTGTKANLIQTDPIVPELQIDNLIRCANLSYDGAYVHGIPYQNYRYLTGRIPSNQGLFCIRGDLPNPGLLLAQHVTNYLNKHNISVRDSAQYITEDDNVQRQLLYTHFSPALDTIIFETNHKSVNLYAEMIFRNLGAESATQSTIRTSTEFIQKFWNDRGVDLSSTRILDGCGLAPQNGISAENLVELITYMMSSKQKDVFVHSLPTSGVDGTLKKFLVSSKLTGRVHAKSGSIKGTRNYAGLIDMPNGEQLVFAILVNGSTSPGKQIQQAIETYLIDVFSRIK